jgi:FkbM family methyltransferase
MSFVRSRYGKFKIINTDSVISESLRMYGEWAQNEIDLLGYFIQPGAVVVDVGAYIGTHARAFSALVGLSGKVLSFEPRHEIYSVLVENAKLASTDNIRAINMALGIGEVSVKVSPLHLAEHSNFGGTNLESKGDQNGAGEIIKITSLDAFELDRLDIIKIDVEGMEFAVLNGAKETVRQCRPVIFAECNSLEASMPIIKWAQVENYQVYGVLSAAYNQHNFAGNAENIFGAAQEIGLLFIPSERFMRYESILLKHELPQIKSADDLVLLLLHKPQYPYEVLANTSVSKILSLFYPSPQADSYRQTLTVRDGEIAKLNQAVIERDTHIRTLVGSKSWLITKPMRWVGRVIRGDFAAALDPIKKALPFNSLDKVLSLTPNNDNLPQACGNFVTPVPIKPTHPVSVILPVYRSIGMTKRCILAAMPGVLAVPTARIIVINDASPDVGMQDMLDQLATQWPNIMVVLKNEKNLGFVDTVNRGFAYFPKHDAVLLNSDVIVPQDWLRRLIEEAYSRDDIGTVTPFSNNATICSFPHFLQENNQPFNLDVDSIDTVFRHAKLPCILAPTGVGFCMYIRRACLDVTGYLNQEKFGRGYGEENDLCQRVLKNGWHNIISPNLYAYHEGGVSFSSDKQALVDRAMKVIDKLHPGYHASVQSFIAQDPLKFARVERHIQFLAITAVPKILHISHAVGGGVGQHIEELAQHTSLQAAHILLTPYGEDGAVSIRLGIGGHTDKLIFRMPNEYDTMVDLLKSIGVSAVHIHHTTGLKAKILDLPHDLGVAHLLTVHDYYWMNGNPTLTDENGQYPGFYLDTLSNPLYPLPQKMTLESWQAQFRRMIEGASCVIFPSNATKALFDCVYETPNAIVAPHIEAQLNVSRKPFFVTNKKMYTIGILGAVGREKGADLLEQIAKASKDLNLPLPLEFKLIGYAYRSLRAVKTTGPYKTQDLPDLIQKHGLDIVFFPAQCPETYSYTLSYALDSGLPIIAPNIGAFPERLSGRANTLLFNHLTPASELLNQINAFIEVLSVGASINAPIFEGDISKYDFYSCDYLPIVSRDLKIVDNEKILVPKLDVFRIISGSKNNATTWRNSLTQALWGLYMNPAMRWVNYVIPYSVRRFIKRSLTRSPIHNVINQKI